MISIHFHYFFGGAESMGSARIIGNTWISIHFHYFFDGAESVGSSRIIENIWISIISLVERRAWEAPESLKTHDFFTFSLFLWWGGERGKLQNH